MTAEITIMNRSAVALAADSAASSGRKGKRKIYNTVSKLFPLSTTRPVAVMVYGNADFGGVPWETIIKLFREELGDAEHETVAGYAGALANYLDKGSPLFPPGQQESFFASMVYSYFREVKEEVDAAVKRLASEAGGVTKRTISLLLRSVLRRRLKQLEGLDTVPNLGVEHAISTVERYDGIFHQALQDIFQMHRLTPLMVQTLRAIAGNLFVRRIVTSLSSGVVVAGFGRNQVFPSFVECRFEGVANDRLKYAPVSEGSISETNQASVKAFAQSEMVHLFMEGVEPNYQSWIEGELDNVFAAVAKAVAAALPGGQDRGQVEAALLSVSRSVLADFERELRTYRRNNNVNPVIEAVSLLPKNELAEMAEALVNLTSFKRRVSMEEETVGGPVDVAVVSKGDGFVWIKRKDYFPHELNPHLVCSPAGMYPPTRRGRDDKEC